MTDHHSSELPAAPTTPAHDTAYAAPTEEPTRRDWRRLGRSRKVLTAGAVVAGLAIGGAGFGAGYAVGDGAATPGTTTQTDTGWGNRGPGGPMGDRDGDMSGQLGVPPDFDGDGQPDTGGGSSTDDGTDSGTTSDSATQQS